jgi:hypothetical protein
MAKRGTQIPVAFGCGSSSAEDVTRLVTYSLAETPADVSYLLNVRVGVGFAI